VWPKERNRVELNVHRKGLKIYTYSPAGALPGDYLDSECRNRASIKDPNAPMPIVAAGTKNRTARSAFCWCKIEDRFFLFEVTIVFLNGTHLPGVATFTS
jgi:hypothetical protein